MNISKERLERMVLNCIDWITSISDCLDAYNDLGAIGFDEAELRELGYGDIVDRAHEQLKEEEEIIQITAKLLKLRRKEIF